MSPCADKVEMWMKKIKKIETAEFARSAQTLSCTASALLKTQFAESVGMSRQSVIALGMSEKESISGQIDIMERQFGVVIGVVEMLRRPYSPANKGKRGIG